MRAVEYSGEPFRRALHASERHFGKQRGLCVSFVELRLAVPVVRWREHARTRLGFAAHQLGDGSVNVG
jgi:hypothetical protein